MNDDSWGQHSVCISQLSVGCTPPGKETADNVEAKEHHNLAINSVNTVGDVFVSPAGEYPAKQKI